MRGDIQKADLSPTQGSEQSGFRPVVILENEAIINVSRTVITIPLTTNQRRASLPTAVFIPQGEGGLDRDSVALCEQIRVLDKSRLRDRLGTLSPYYLAEIERTLLYTLGIATT